MAEFDLCQVECYSGHTYAQEPRAVILHGHRYPVSAVLERWRTPRGPAFSVETETGERLEVHYAELDDTWRVRLLARDGALANRRDHDRERPHNDDKEVSEG